MNNLFDMLTKAGYEASSIGNDVLPCTLRIGEEPIGFLMGDLSLRLLPNRETERGRLQPILAFSADNQGIEQEKGEYVLSSYQNVLFTANFDYDSCQPVYNIYFEDKEKNRTLLDSSGDKAAAARAFTKRSGLVSGDIPEPVRNVGRINRFMEEIRKKGYEFRESREKASRTYDITDQEDHVVGYISKNNRVTITSENRKDRRALTSAYLSSNSEEAMLPTFFERLKERLKEIGMALKVAFTPKGRHYAIHNGNHQRIATVGEQSHQVTYTDLTTDAEKAKIDALIDEIQRENTMEQTPDNAVEGRAAAVTEEKAAPEAPSVSTEEIQRLAGVILSDRAAADTFLDAVLSNPEFVTALDQRLAETRENAVPKKEASVPMEKERPIAKEVTSREDSSTEKIKQEFNQAHSYLQTLFGFNQEKYNALRAEMVTKFGTDDPQKFQASLEAKQLTGTGRLKDRLKVSRMAAEAQNAARQTEKTQEKERA